MIHLFVIADDFTGALDTGVQFASYGAATKVVVGTGLQALEADAQTQVLVVDAETRHLPAAQAYDTVYRLVRWAKEKKIGCIYKKTDSALRGNIGAELSAALAADGGDRLHFVPAFPNLDRVTRGGVLTGHKSLTPEGTELHRPALCEADLADLAQAAALGVSAVMQPFVRSADDLRTVRQAMAENGLAHAELFAKVEDQTGLDALPDWMDLCDVVTIARGDLGSSLPLEQLPAAQKHIAALCRSRRKPFLVVTQLLHSMIDHPTPTRAEVLDIYNAVLDGADCLMLTGETAQGRYPLAALDWLMRVAQEAQRAR